MLVNQERLLQDIDCLPPIARQEAIDFIAFLKARHGPYAAPETVGGASAMREEPFVGMWEDRSELADSTAWVKDSRRKECGQ
uniref:DUF2281 domain-containing protein n=1 Tax=Candidatus Kentrum sp. SD TaxID=2126332 RepID=A0A451BNI9_9GAMM|nr:MAG: hypothetical protein BECKSD772D_GA0070982_10717 [Candidatus Kentron sp. SD]